MVMLKDNALSFNHEGWTPDTQITLTNVPWNNDYRDIVPFDSRAALDAYIDASEKYGAEIVGTYARVNMPVKISVPFEVAQGFNYLRARNGAQPIPGGSVARTFYYFIIDVKLLAPNTTELTVQLDVIQSFLYDIEFGQSYVERGHIGIANENNFDNNGRDYLTIPEGLDIGNEYVTAAYRRNTIAATNQVAAPSIPWNVPYGYMVMITSTVDLFANAGTVESPKLETAKGSMIQGLPSGASVYTCDPAMLPYLLSYLKAKPWISQGIVSIQAIPAFQNWGWNVSYTYSIIPGSDGFGPTTGGYAGRIQLAEFTTKGGKAGTFTGITNWRSSADITNYIPERYRHLKKLLTYPYCAIEVTFFNGKPLILKPESWNDPNSTMDLRPILMPGHQKIVATPRSYNAPPGAVLQSWTNDNGNTERGDDGGEYLDVSTQLDNFPSFAVVNDSFTAFMAQNNNSIWAANLGADWAQQRALSGNGVAYDNASAAMNLASDLNNNTNWADAAQVAAASGTNLAATLLGGAGNIISGTAGGAVVGGPPGAAAGLAAGAGTAAMSAAQALLGINQAQNAQQIRQQSNTSATNLGNRTSGLIRDTNKNFADFAARGDYMVQNASINAKVQDARLIQPTTSGQQGGDAFNLVYNNMVLSFRYKMIDHAAMSVVGDYWLRYGYAVRRFMQMPASLHVMTKFTYWKLSETYIKAGRMPESMKQVIRGIFEKGVTVWKSPADIGNIDIADNAPLEGISY